MRIPFGRQRFSIHGLAVDVVCHPPDLREQIELLLSPFAVNAFPDGFLPSFGVIRPYDEAMVLRSVSAGAVRISAPEDPIELFRDGERFWVVDERVGMIEIDPMRGRWRAWILPRCAGDLVRTLDVALFWPLGQLLRNKGLSLLPAPAIASGQWGALVLCPFSIEPEIRQLLGAGYHMVGQRWTALREEETASPHRRLEMLRIPGFLERSSGPRLRESLQTVQSPFVDLARECPAAMQNFAFCDALLIVEPGRRNVGYVHELSSQRAEELLRSAWPLPELHGARRYPALAMKMAHRCRCCQVQLSRAPGDLAMLLDELRGTARGSNLTATPAPSALWPESYRRVAV